KVEAKLTDNMVFLPIVDSDDTLVGQPGDTLKFPVYAYIGDASDVSENGQIIPVALSETFTTATVKKTAKAVQVTDEARLSGHGDPIDEATAQIAKAIDNKTDNDVLAALEGVSTSRQYGTVDSISPDVVSDSLTIFGEDDAGVKAFYIAPADKATLRKSDDFIKATEIGQDMILSGAFGELFGCQMIPANKIKSDDASGEMRRFIVKPGALKIINKQGTFVESKREPDYMRDTIFASKHYTVYLYDESKVVMIRQFTALKTLSDDAVSSAAGAESNGTMLDIKVGAPVGYKWVYKLGTTDGSGTFGTALTGYTDWVNAATEIAASTSTKAHVCLVNSSDNKPVKQINVTLTKKA
ncbi:MAG: N4-gp56 family major capsid protein, partial [Selenomonadaceae bacterium]